MRTKIGVLLGSSCALWLAACTVTSVREAPIVERSERPGAPTRVETAPASGAPAAVSAREAKDGVYLVQRGDTLYSIALAFGQDYRDLARWNGLEDPARLQVGQALRVQAPAAEAAATAAPVAPVAAAEVRPLDAPAPVPSVAPAAAGKGVEVPRPAAPAPATAVAEPAKGWVWPAAGKLIERFDELRNKGIDIAGAEGEPVNAANDGTVVYSGSGLRGYGNLVIIKHTDDFISAYAHNRHNLVKQGEVVKRGQQIAELGRSDADVPKLHFEIRRQGKPVDPMRFLPPR